MSKALIVCPACGRRVPLGRYCSSCGSPLMPEAEDAGSHPHSSLQAHLVLETPGNEEELPDFGIVVDGVNPADLSAFLTRSELEIIDGELDELIEAIRATRQALALENADREALATRTQELKDSLERVRRRKEELLRARASISLQVLVSQLHETTAKISRLDEASSSLDSDVYREQKSALSREAKNLKRTIKQQVKTARKWLKSMAKARRALEKEASRLEARRRIGDLSPQEYRLQRSRVDRRIRILDGGYKTLEEIVRVAQSV